MGFCFVRVLFPLGSFLCGSISSFRFLFLDAKNKHLLLQSEYAKSDQFFLDLRIRWPKSSDFGPKSDDRGHQLFKSKNGMVSEFKMLSTTASNTRTIDELDGDTIG